MRFSQVWTSSFICLFIAACSSTPEPKKDIVSQFHGILPQLMQNDEGLFHGISLGMTLPEVKEHVVEGDSIGAEQKDYLEFEGKLSPAKIYDYDCNFDEKGLKDLTVDIHLKDEKNADSLYADFKSYFNKRYGIAAETDGTSTWSSKEGKRPAKIVLSEEEDYPYGKLTITFYDLSLDPPATTPDSILITGDSLVLP